MDEKTTKVAEDASISTGHMARLVPHAGKVSKLNCLHGYIRPCRTKAFPDRAEWSQYYVQKRSYWV